MCAAQGDVHLKRIVCYVHKQTFTFDWRFSAQKLKNLTFYFRRGISFDSRVQ